MQREWTVHKFGGSSLAGADEFGRVADIVQADETGLRAVVVSASFGVTDRLVALLDRAVTSEPAWEQPLAELREHHVGLANRLIAQAHRAEIVRLLDDDLSTIRKVLDAAHLFRSVPDEATSLVTGTRANAVALAVSLVAYLVASSRWSSVDRRRRGRVPCRPYSGHQIAQSRVGGGQHATERRDLGAQADRRRKRGADCPARGQSDRDGAFYLHRLP